eukprot:1159321-Pelagomonas_calceolata.AAC.11
MHHAPEKQGDSHITCKQKFVISITNTGCTHLFPLMFFSAFSAAWVTEFARAQLPTQTVLLACPECDLECTGPSGPA